MNSGWYRGRMPFAPWEVVLILVVLLLVFGASRLPQMGRSLGRGMREFKDAVTGEERTSSPPAELPAAPSEPARSETEPEPADKSERETVR